MKLVVVLPFLWHCVAAELVRRRAPRRVRLGWEVVGLGWSGWFLARSLRGARSR